METLDSIKAFVNLPNCIFVVPFDDEIIKGALETRREKQFGDCCDVIESELILDKLFQFKTYLPPLLKYDIGDYTMKLVRREIPDFMKDYCSDEIMNRLVNRILIHSDVTTPRQVKKLINAFVNNYLIAREREESGRVEKGLLTGERGVEQIAKLSVLQADYNSFYDLLFKDFSYIDKFVEIAQGNHAGTDVPTDLRKYFLFEAVADDDSVAGVLPTYEPLLNFLMRTAKYSVKSLAPFLYLAQNAISIKTGDEQQRRAVAALESGNSATLKTLLDEKSEIAEAIISFIPDCSDAELSLQAAYPLINFVDEKYTKSLANTLIERSIDLDVDMNELSLSVSAKSVFDVSKQAEKPEYGVTLTEKYLSAIANKNKSNTDIIIETLKVYLPVYNSLSNDAQSALLTVTRTCCDTQDIQVKSILPLLDYTDNALFTLLWGENWLNKLCSHISDENDYSPDVIDSLKESFPILFNNEANTTVIGNVLPLFELPPLLNVLNEIFNNGVCSELNADQSTRIVNELVKHEYDAKSETSRIVHELLGRLNYVIDDDNSDAMTAFTANYTTSALMDDVLVYLGKSGFFSYIENTLNSLVTEIFEDDNNDELLGKISSYLTDSVRDKLFTLLRTCTQKKCNQSK